MNNNNNNNTKQQTTTIKYITNKEHQHQERLSLTGAFQFVYCYGRQNKTLPVVFSDQIF